MLIAPQRTATLRRARQLWRRSPRTGGGTKRKPRTCRGFPETIQRGCHAMSPL